MEKIGIVRSVKGQGTYEGKYGTMYKYEIVFDNGDSGEYSSKKYKHELDEGFPFIVSQSAKYELSEVNGYTKIKPVTENSFNGPGGKSFQRPDQTNEIVYQVCLKEAREIVALDGWNGNEEMKDKLKYLSDIAYQLAVYSKANINKLKKQ